MNELSGKFALVTGAGRGIGRAIALELAQAGCDVALLARTREQVEEVAATIRARGRRSIALVADLTKTQQVHQALIEAKNTLSPISILVNNAGLVGPIGPTVDVDPELWTRSIATNLIGPFQLIHDSLPTMLAQGWGRILNISSAASIAPGMVRGSAYGVSKAGLENMTLNLATEIAGSGVTVNAVRPGIVETSMETLIRSMPIEQVGPQILDFIDSGHREGRVNVPEVPARLVVRLLSTETTGEVVSVYDARGKALLA